MKQAVIRHKGANDTKWEKQAGEWKISEKKKFIDEFLALATTACNEGKEEAQVKFPNFIPGMIRVNGEDNEAGIRHKDSQACAKQFIEALKTEMLQEFEAWGFKASSSSGITFAQKNSPRNASRPQSYNYATISWEHATPLVD